MLGLAGVFVFFAISGFLVTQSFEQTHGPVRYLAKRCLRIFPGFIVVLVLTAFVLGPLVTTLPLGEYLRRSEPYRYVLDNLVFSLKVHELPGVMFVDNTVGLEVNGSLWSLGYEFEMYLMVLALGLLRLINLPVCLLLLALGIAANYLDLFGFLAWTGIDWAGWGWMLGFFAAGMVLYKLRDTRVFDYRIALVAVAGLIASVILRQFIALFPLFGCYLALYLALHPKLPVIEATRFGDLSYGLYIYGWPAEQLVIWLLRGHAEWWQVFVLANLLTIALAFLSWHLVEKRALRLKPGRGTWQGGRLGIWPKRWLPKSPTAATSTSNTAGLSN
jgi:peptidoglycan/LPS O-acetylase OafA/YrhL